MYYIFIFIDTIIIKYDNFIVVIVVIVIVEIVVVV